VDPAPISAILPRVSPGSAARDGSGPPGRGGDDPHARERRFNGRRAGSASSGVPGHMTTLTIVGAIIIGLKLTINGRPVGGSLELVVGGHADRAGRAAPARLPCEGLEDGARRAPHRRPRPRRGLAGVCAQATRTPTTPSTRMSTRTFIPSRWLAKLRLAQWLARRGRALPVVGCRPRPSPGSAAVPRSWCAGDPCARPRSARQSIC